MPLKVLNVNILRKISFALICWLAATLAYGQGNIAFEASSSTRQVLLDNYFEVTFNLKNATGSQFAPPSFKDFIVIAGPSTSSSVRIYNGEVNREIGYSYTLKPTKVGKLTIGSASVKADGKVYRSSPISIEVLKNTARPKDGGGGQEYFIRLEPNKKQAYVGEQITLDFKLYTRVGIERYEIPEDPNYDGFYAVELRRFSSNTVQEVLNGQQYATKVLRRIALFPQQTGKLTIEPFRIQLAVVEEGGSTGFFFNRNVKPVFFTTDAIEIMVKPIPVDEPEGYCGAVGNFELQAGIDRKLATTDEAITFNLVLTGNGDVKRINPPIISFSDSFEVYEPKMVGEKTDEIRGEIVSEKSFEYLLLPKFAGDFNIKPVVSYFNTEIGQYANFEVGPFPLSVKSGTGSKNTAFKNRGDAEINDILPVKPITNLDKKAWELIGSPAFYLLVLLPILLFGFLLLRQKKQKELANADPAILKVKSAGREAQKRLAVAKQQLQLGNSRGFYDEVSKAYMGYICDKTGLTLVQFSKENVGEKLQSLKVNQSTVTEFLKILQICEVALFAGMDNPASMQTTYENAIGVITAIESESGTINT